MNNSLLQEMYEMESDYWWHKGKRLHVFSIMKKFGRRKPKVLDVGCGTGYLLKELSRYSQAYGLDKSKRSLSFCSKRGLKKIYNIDIERDTFPNVKFDIITALDVIEHIKDDKKAMINISKSLKKGGVVIVTTPAFEKLWSYWDVEVGHYRRYSTKEIKKLFRESGFTIAYMRFTNISIFVPALMIRMIKEKFNPHNSKQHSSDFIKVPNFINALLYLILKIEMYISSLIFIPFGLSLIIVGKKSK